MSEWWTYRLSDFLMFSPAAYWRLVERYNREAWPLHLLMLGAGLALLWLAARKPVPGRRVMAAALAAIWLWVGWAFHHRTYVQINWAADYAAIAFAVQAALLAGLGVLGTRPSAPPEQPSGRRIGLAIGIAGVLGYPFAAALAGRPWSQAEVFGLMPEPTALATLGLLFASNQPRRAWLSVLPIASLVVGWATLWQLVH